ncbi:hypothetical protein NCS56_01350000 [Fusarium sp. Ph1]|nr:hypothetical protein NCS56_01350000 [Fusarium sp. Ph1]
MEGRGDEGHVSGDGTSIIGISSDMGYLVHSVPTFQSHITRSLSLSFFKTKFRKHPLIHCSRHCINNCHKPHLDSQGSPYVAGLPAMQKSAVPQEAYLSATLALSLDA